MGLRFEGNLRWRQPVERHQERDQPEDRVCDFDGELGDGEEEWEQADVAGDGEWAESS